MQGVQIQIGEKFPYQLWSIRVHRSRGEKQPRSEPPRVWLHKANEILRLASIFIAQAELDRRFKPCGYLLASIAMPTASNRLRVSDFIVFGTMAVGSFPFGGLLAT